MTVAGYTTPWSVSAGCKVSLHISCGEPPQAVTLCRLDSDAPELADWRIEPTATPPRRYEFDQGSYLAVRKEQLRKAGPITGLGFELFLTKNESWRTIFQFGQISLCLRGCALLLEGEGRSMVVDGKVPLRTWLTILLRKKQGSTKVSVQSHDALTPHHVWQSFEEFAWNALDGDLLLGTNSDLDHPTLNAKFSAVNIETESGPIAWRFPALLETGPILSTGGNVSLKLEVINQPAFCMTSVRWDGSSFDPKLVPSHYDAVHCHDDDMGALDWPASYQIIIPANARPGVYAFQVECHGAVERIVFFISSSKPQSRLIFVVPTATYLAYADEFLPRHLYEWKCDDRGHRFIVDNNLKSLYDYHSDLSGFSICSYKKPKVTLRDDYRYPLCGCPHNLPVDLHFLRFCHNHGIELDLITDHDLHERGLELLRGYRSVITGSHPEYLSVEMESAYRQFAAGGGSIAYLGGNGFASTVAFKGDLMELRRSPLESVRTWDGVVGEQALSITNEPGGHLRSRERGEFSLVGGAISLMGFESARPFTRTAASFDPELAWLFEGVENDTFGDEGIVLGGAAGYEVDATSPHLGTSPDTIVLARANGFSESMVDDPARWYERGDGERASRRCAEMTIRHLASGSLIFSASSVAWCGALPTGQHMNDVGKITLNLLNHISTPGRAEAVPARNG